MEENQLYEKFGKIDIAIERLVGLSSDLSKMLAVHQQQLAQQEKQTDLLVFKLEQRRDAVDEKFDSVLETIKREDSSIVKKVDDVVEVIKKIEYKIWFATGATASISAFIAWILHILTALH